MKTYRGIREPSCHVLVLRGAGDGAAYELSVPRELLTRPPGPFDWGSGTESPGAHYLAIALLADLLSSTDRALIRSLLPPMRRFLSRLPQEGFEISDTVFQALLHAVAGGTRPDSQPQPAQPGTQASEVRGPIEPKPPPLPGSRGADVKSEI